MDDYIEREQAYQIAKLIVDYIHSDKYHPVNLGAVIMDMIDDISPADVQPVIYCKDCYVYRKDKELARAAYLDEDYYCALLRTEMPSDGFCYYGRRRNDDD